MLNALCGIGDEAGASLTEQITALADLGWSRIELRSVDSVPIADLDDRAFREVRRRLADAGITASALASRIGGWARPVTAPFGPDLAELAVLAERAHALGTRFIRVMSYPNDGMPEEQWREVSLTRLADLATRAARDDVVLLHENCAGWAARSARHAIAMLTTVGSPALRLLFDTGNGVAYGYDSLDLVRALRPWVDHVHVKDGRPGPVFTLPGRGDARVRECLSLLLASGYCGDFSIEPHTHLLPHVNGYGDGLRPAFVAYGRHLESLLAEITGPGACHGLR